MIKTKTDINVDALTRAVARLEEGWSTYHADPDFELIRDGLIQRFEFTYEISHKLLKRYLQEIVPDPDALREMNFPDLIRTANEYNLLKGDWSNWKVYRDMRSKTSHTYDKEIALEVVAGIPEFLQEAKFLLEKMSK